MYLNDYIDNQYQASDFGNDNKWDCMSRGNYWSDYTGVDIDSDGIGETPYLVLPNGSDRFPLMKPAVWPIQVSLQGQVVLKINR